MRASERALIVEADWRGPRRLAVRVSDGTGRQMIANVGGPRGGSSFPVRAVVINGGEVLWVVEEGLSTAAETLVAVAVDGRVGEAAVAATNAKGHDAR